LFSESLTTLISEKEVMKMKGIFLGILLIGGLGAIGILSQEGDGRSLTALPVVLANAAPDEASTVEVDHANDPAADLPCTTAPNDCSLHSAINIANSDGVPTTITFADHYLITLERPLPVLSENGTTIHARPEQEVHVNGNNIAQSVFYINGAQITLSGLRIYGAGAGYSNLTINGAAYDVTIANNVIGDGDAPSGNCGQSDQSYGGIYINSTESIPTAVRVWIYGNIIECHRGGPGDGVTIVADKVMMGQDSSGQAGPAQRNIIRENNGRGVSVGEHSGNTICNTVMHDNKAGNLWMTNFNNDVMSNDMR
jgi:hypothetical protein